MPTNRPRAAFEPIAPDLDIGKLVEETPHFQYVDRIACDMIDQQGLEAFDRLVLLHVIIGGKPLVIDGYQSRLDPWTFSSNWLQDNHGDKVEHARDLTKQTNLPLSVGHYMRNMNKLADQYFENSENYKDTKSRQRIYLKDIDCPPVWADKLRDQLPPNLFYLNESSGEPGGPGSIDEPGPNGGRRKSRGIAPAGDLMSSLPPPMRAENLMCYIGHEGTYTPAHKEMCGSLGHNIMVETSETIGEDGKPEKPGSSIWFMTETKDREVVSEYWLSVLGHDIEVEKHFAQIAAWRKAPFTVYVVEQRAGDFILIPPLAPHQVWNRGTRTMKVAWNRTTVETLEKAVSIALPDARLVCREEQYKNKAMIYYTLQKYSGLLNRLRDQQQTAPSPQATAILRQSPKIRQLTKDFRKLFQLFKQIMLSEMFSLENPHERNVQFNPFDSNITCAYCRGNIFNRFLTCPGCEHVLGTPSAEPYDICMECFVMGRSCGCIAKFRWAEQFKWKELVHRYETWRRQIIDLTGGKEQPLSLQEERTQLHEKPLAQICQEELKRRPKRDISKALKPVEDEEESDEEIIVNDDGTVKKTKKKRSEAWLNNNWTCHHCCHRHEKWKMMSCTTCQRKWCFGTLYRGYDLMPGAVLEDPEWKCPHCNNICNAASCRKDPRQKAYEPKGTVLGHDTKAVADVRSVESLVDFGVSNRTWLSQTPGGPSNRLEKRALEAHRNKENEDALSDEDAGNGDINPTLGGADDHIEYESTLIDPALGGGMDGSNTFHFGGGLETSQSQGFVAPSAIMLRPPEENNSRFDDRQSSHNDAESVDDTELSQVRKRALEAVENLEAIKRQPAKRVRLSEGGRSAISGASKQFQKEKERKSLEEARKNGQYIMSLAAMRGKSKIVKLQVNPESLARIISGTGDDKILLQSDLAPPEQPRPSGPTKAVAKAGKQVRIRVEDDGDFGSSSRRRKKAGGVDSKGKRSQVAYEDVELDSLSDEELEEADDAQDGTFKGSRDRSSRRNRRSTWQAQHHQSEDEELPDELPTDWKDGRKKSRSAPVTRTSVSGKSVARILPPTYVSSIQDEGFEDGDEETAQLAVAALSQGLTPKAVNVHNNDDAMEDSDDTEADEDDDGTLVKPVVSSFTPVNSHHAPGKPNPIGKSIFAKQRLGGRAVKIVSGKKNATSM